MEEMVTMLPIVNCDWVGGNGGNIFIRVAPAGTDLSTLLSAYRATNGGRGKNRRGHGLSGEDCVVDIPKGTIAVSVPDAGHDTDMFIDTSHPLMPVGTKFLVSRGGRGGRGNHSFLTPQNRSPQESTDGEPGEERRFQLTLKTIADVGLVGLPNAGKSSFLQAVSHSKTNIGAYAFTTLSPFLGTIQFPPTRIETAKNFPVTSSDDNTAPSGVFKLTASQIPVSPPTSITIADIPGLVQNASQNRGLGHSFLKHIERSKVLAYIVDLSSTSPWTDLCTLREELEKYMPGMTMRRSVVIANKADRCETKQDEELLVERNFKILVEKMKLNKGDIQIVPISAKYRKNVDKALEAIKDLVLMERKNEIENFKILAEDSRNTKEPVWKTDEYVRGISTIHLPSQKSR